MNGIALHEPFRRPISGAIGDRLFKGFCFMGTDYSGQVFGMLTALYKDQDLKKGKNGYWFFYCSCGENKSIKMHSVRSGDIKSCGCLKRKKQDISGKRFHRLVALRSTGKIHNSSYLWECICDCGNKKNINVSTLNSMRVHSCGCYGAETLAAGRNRGFKEGSVWRTKEYYRDWKRERRKNDPLFVLKSRITCNLRSSLKFIGVKKCKASFDILGYTPEELYRHIERCFSKGMTWDNRSKWHIDHIIPLSTAKTEDDLIRLNQLSNLRPMWAMENIKKANKVTTLL